MDFRGHDHVVECAIFLPVVSYPFVLEWLEANVIKKKKKKKKKKHHSN
jgi:platelet-activating factor acetylhydrolase IB subunit alpha